MRLSINGYFIAARTIDYLPIYIIHTTISIVKRANCVVQPPK